MRYWKIEKDLEYFKEFKDSILDAYEFYKLVKKENEPIKMFKDYLEDTEESESEKW